VVLVHFIDADGVALRRIGFIVYTVVRVSWSSPLMRRFWLRVPFIGSSLKTAYAYRWITALKLEFSAGVSLSRAVGDAWRASGYVGCDRFAEEGEQAMREETDLSKLVRQWKQLPRDWIDFIETGEISGAFERLSRTWKRKRPGSLDAGPAAHDRVGAEDRLFCRFADRGGVLVGSSCTRWRSPDHRCGKADR
jgi:hypothetical protein